MAVIEWRFMIQMVLSQAKHAWILRNLPILACISWLIDNVPVSQLALICTLKGGKYNTEAEQMNGVAPCTLNSSLKLFTNVSVSETIDLIFKDPVLLQLAASASFCSAVCWIDGSCVHAAKGWTWLAAGGTLISARCPSSPRLAGCMYRGRSSASSDTGKV